MKTLPLLLLLAAQAAHADGGKVLQASCTPWYEGYLTSADGIVAGEVVAASGDVLRSASEVRLEESCEIRVESVPLVMPELAGVTTLVLKASRGHDPYQQPEPGWGKYQHLKPGQRVVAVLHRHETAPAIGEDALIVLNAETRALPAILRRTGLDPARFTDDDLVVLQMASPRLYREMAGLVAFAREKQGGAWNEWQMRGALLVLIVALVMAQQLLRQAGVFKKAAARAKKRDFSPRR